MDEATPPTSPRIGLSNFSYPPSPNTEGRIIALQLAEARLELRIEWAEAQAQTRFRQEQLPRLQHELSKMCSDDLEASTYAPAA